MKASGILLLSLAFTALRSAGATPQIIWATDPVRPGETLVLTGDGFTGNSVVEVSGSAAGES